MNTRTQKVIIERQDASSWFVMHDDGTIEDHTSSLRALRSVRKRAKENNKDLTLTTVEWRNVPEGWSPPK